MGLVVGPGLQPLPRSGPDNKRDTAAYSSLHSSTNQTGGFDANMCYIKLTIHLCIFILLSFIYEEAHDGSYTQDWMHRYLLLLLQQPQPTN